MQPVVLDPLKRLILEVGIPLDDPAAQDLQVNLPPPIMQEAGLLQDNNTDCQICSLGRRVNRVVLLCGHCVCSECADNIVIWEGTDATCPNMSKCFFCRMRVQSIHRIFVLSPAGHQWILPFRVTSEVPFEYPGTLVLFFRSS